MPAPAPMPHRVAADGNRARRTPPGARTGLRKIAAARPGLRGGVRRMAARALVAALVCAAACFQVSLAWAFTMTSPALRDSDKLGRQYACEGGDRSPALYFSSPPAGAKSLAVLMVEQGAPKGNATLWIIYNLPPGITALTENQPHSRALKGETMQLQNSGGKFGYSGPCPPGAATRHFVIEAFALDTLLDLPDNADRRAFLLAVEGHILSRAKLSGRYKK